MINDVKGTDLRNTQPQRQGTHNSITAQAEFSGLPPYPICCTLGHLHYILLNSACVPRACWYIPARVTITHAICSVHIHINQAPQARDARSSNCTAFLRLFCLAWPTLVSTHNTLKIFWIRPIFPPALNYTVGSIATNNGSEIWMHSRQANWRSERMRTEVGSSG